MLVLPENHILTTQKEEFFTIKRTCFYHDTVYFETIEDNLIKAPKSEIKNIHSMTASERTYAFPYVVSGVLLGGATPYFFTSHLGETARAISLLVYTPLGMLAGGLVGYSVYQSFAAKDTIYYSEGEVGSYLDCGETAYSPDKLGDEYSGGMGFVQMRIHEKVKDLPFKTINEFSMFRDSLTENRFLHNVEFRYTVFKKDLIKADLRMFNEIHKITLPEHTMSFGITTGMNFTKRDYVEQGISFDRGGLGFSIGIAMQEAMLNTVSTSTAVFGVYYEQTPISKSGYLDTGYIWYFKQIGIGGYSTTNFLGFELKLVSVIKF